MAKRSERERQEGGFPGEKLEPARVPVHPDAVNARVWVIECDHVSPGIARIAERGGGARFKYGGEIRIQIAGDTADEVEKAMGWFLKTFPSAEIRPVYNGLSYAEQKQQKPYVLNPVRLGEAVG